MSRTRLEFFATPDEQRSWLRTVLLQQDAWCQARGPGGEPFRAVRADTLDQISFFGSHRHDLTFYLGLSSLTHGPVWQVTTDNRTEIDFVRSLAIQFSASVVVAGSILLDGQIAVMPWAHYREAGLNALGLQRWFDRIGDSFAALGLANARVVQRTTAGQLKEWPSFVVTRGAEAWWRGGNRLKQFVDGPVEFGVSTDATLQA